MNIDWITSFEALKNVYIDEAYSNIAINEAISHHKGCRDSFVRVMVKGTIRDTIRLDHIIGTLATDGLKGIRNRTLIVLRMGLYALRSMDSVPEHAAVNEAVSLSRKVAKGTDKFVNAVLRSYIRRRDELESQELDLATRYSFPDGIVELLESQYGEETEAILRGLSEPAPLVLRTNFLRTDASSLAAMLGEAGISCSTTDVSPRALIAEGSNVLGTKMYRDGLFTVQSLSSIAAIEALCPQPGSRVLDMCAAPGGKTTMMAEMMDNKGSIVACDIHEHRLGLIEAACRRLGADIVETRLMDGSCHDPALDESFDYVLCDVPCSGLGVISSKPEIKLRSDVSEYKELSALQLEILKNAVRYAKPGALIEYSTCTLNRMENEGVINKLLEESSLVSVVEMHNILPYNNLVGFYYSILRKNA
ncbi:MAG: 16S rRNA (cytosine(967)-C(5))-methyltransferase RsmB [Mogibacterium sp.]|nr:16S rRNA (cytosine(967)-C(5))-methyltransferase RsmB [Mogibacterium sp.]